MIIELLILLIALGVWCPRRRPWDLLGMVCVVVLVVIWLARVLAPTLVRV